MRGSKCTNAQGGEILTNGIWIKIFVIKYKSNVKQRKFFESLRNEKMNVNVLIMVYSLTSFLTFLKS